MSILDINDKKWNTQKTLIVYFVLTILAYVVNKVYALFGHGVSSNSMTWMFLYPLIGGFAFFLAIRIAFNKVNKFAGYRVFYNLHNSGIAMLTLGSLANGILEIAGTTSTYTKLFFIAGWLLIAVGIILLIIFASNQRKLQNVS